MFRIKQVFSSATRSIEQRLRRSLPKPLYLALLGACGCILGALLGEALLAATRSPPPAGQRANTKSICVVIDTSSSMGDGKLAEVQDAALQFVVGQDLSRCSIAVVQFDDHATLLVPASDEILNIESAIEQMGAGGSTAMHDGLLLAEDAISGAPGTQHILLFTDGFPDSTSAARSAAHQARNCGIQIIAIGTGDADQRFLAELTGNPNLVLWAHPGEIKQAFEDAQTMIANASLVDAQTAAGLPLLLIRVGLWTSLLASGLGLALIAGQNRCLRRRLLSRPDLFKGGGGSVVAGFAAGAAGQTLFWIIRTEATATVGGSVILGAALGGFLARCRTRMSGRQTAIMMGVGAVTGLLIATLLYWLYMRVPAIYYIVSILAWVLAGGILGLTTNRLNCTVHERRAIRRGCASGLVGIVLLFIADAIGMSPAVFLTDTTTRIIGWIILGAAMGRGMALFVPNLDHLKATIAGGSGGLIGAITLLSTGDHFGELAGRILGAGVLGSSIGAMTVLVELASRETWLEISHVSGDVSTVNLGRNPVFVGDDGVISTKPAGDAPTVGLCYRVVEGCVTCEDLADGNRVPVFRGTERTVGGAAITIHEPSPRS